VGRPFFRDCSVCCDTNSRHRNHELGRSVVGIDLGLYRRCLRRIILSLRRGRGRIQRVFIVQGLHGLICRIGRCLCIGTRRAGVDGRRAIIGWRPIRRSRGPVRRPCPHGVLRQPGILHRPAAEHGLHKLSDIGIELAAGQARSDRMCVRDNSGIFVSWKICGHRGVSAKRERGYENCSGD
jgi:hypothetical protein